MSIEKKLAILDFFNSTISFLDIMHICDFMTIHTMSKQLSSSHYILLDMVIQSTKIIFVTEDNFNCTNSDS